MCPGPASAAPASLPFLLKPSSYMDHLSLAAKFKPSWTTREQSSSSYRLRRRTNTPSQTHSGKVKQSLSQPCTSVDVDPGSGPLRTPTAHTALSRVSWQQGFP